MAYDTSAAITPSAGGFGLTPDALQQIADAVAAAEQRTSAEIRVVITGQPLVQHPFFSLMWAALPTLVLPWVIALLRPLTALAVLELQAVIFLVAAGVLLAPPVARHVVPRSAQKAAARAAAIEAFLAYGISGTSGRTGLLIFVAARERLVEVVADDGVHRVLGAGAWADICAEVAREAGQGRLAEGLVAGVRKAGDLIAPSLPLRPGDRNELADRVVVI